MTMGKTAENERLKLTATFLNNIGVTAVAVAAGLSLYKLFANTTPDIMVRLKNMSFWEMFDRGSGVLGALALAIFLHVVARKILSKLQD